MGAQHAAEQDVTGYDTAGSGMATPWLHACLAGTALALMASAEASGRPPAQTAHVASLEPAGTAVTQKGAALVDAAMLAQLQVSSAQASRPSDVSQTHADHHDASQAAAGPLASPPTNHAESGPTHRFDATEAAAIQLERAGEAAADAATSPGEDAGEPSALEECAEIEANAQGLLQRVRRSLSVTTCASSAWLDGLFGDQFLSEAYRQTHGTVSLGGIWSDYDGFDPRLRFRVRLQLPQWDERISAFAGRVSQDEYITDTEGDFVALPTRQFGSPEDESVLVGLGYSSPERTGNDFDAGVGVRVDLPLDPYVRARYEIVRTFSDHYVFTARETLFWQNSEGFGSTTRVHLDRFISERFLLRWATLGKFTEETVGLQWFTQFTLFHSLSPRTGLAWQVQTEGLTDGEVPLTRHAARVIMRRQLHHDWLILEVRGGVTWPKRYLHEKREPSPEVGVALEMHFGDWD